MDKLELTKKAVNLVVGLAVGKVVKNIIQNNTSPGTLPDKAAHVVGGIVLGGMIADLSRGYTDALIDNIADWWYYEKVTSRTDK
jgi:uncharacterized membrane protein YeaQ/YmgE (transglycosylase-associated protein family)